MTESSRSNCSTLSGRPIQPGSIIEELGESRDARILKEKDWFP